MTQFGWTLKLLIMAAALLLDVAAQAQQKAPQSTAPRAAPKATTKSACNQISDEAKCKAEAMCSWIAALTEQDRQAEAQSLLPHQVQAAGEKG